MGFGTQRLRGSFGVRRAKIDAFCGPRLSAHASHRGSTSPLRCACNRGSRGDSSCLKPCHVRGISARTSWGLPSDARLVRCHTPSRLRLVGGGLGAGSAVPLSAFIVSGKMYLGGLCMWPVILLHSSLVVHGGRCLTSGPFDVQPSTAGQFDALLVSLTQHGPLAKPCIRLCG